MAKITPGAIISEISGSIAAVTYSRSKYGMYSKAKLIQSNPDTPAQQAARAIQAAAVTAWQSLSPALQAEWNKFAAGQLSKPRLSLRSSLNGYNAFIRFFITRHTYGLSGNPDPVNEQPLGMYSSFSFVASTSSILLSLDGNNANTDIMAVARLSGPRSPGQSTITQSEMTIMDYDVAPNGSDEFSLLSAWETKWGSISGFIGMKIFARIDIVNRLTAQKVAVFRGAGVINLSVLIVGVTSNAVTNNVMTSQDGITWILQSGSITNQWLDVVYSQSLGLFCAVSGSGTGNRVMTSPDGINWTTRTSAADNVWRGLAWSQSLGLFCAVGATGTGDRVMTSPDGINWTIRTSAADNQWRSVAWSESLGLFCAVSLDGSGNRVMTSPDGITWTIRTSAANNSWRSVAWSESLGLFCAVSASGTDNRVMTSPDGITWTIRTSAANNGWQSVAWSESLGLFCAVSATGAGNRVMTSPDGITWTIQTSAANNQWNTVIWSPGLNLFIAVSTTGTGNRVMTSPDGITWTIRTSAANNAWIGLASNG